MVSSSRKVSLAGLEHSRSARDAATIRELERVIQRVLATARGDLEQTKDPAHITVSVCLTTLNRGEFAALAELVRAHEKGYGPATLLPLLAALAGVFRR